jgi:hypothetical protein
MRWAVDAEGMKKLKTDTGPFIEASRERSAWEI